MTAEEWIECKRRLMAFGYTSEEAVDWLALPHPQLDGLSAVVADASKVHAIIDRLESGAYI